MNLVILFALLCQVLPSIKSQKIAAVNCTNPKAIVVKCYDEQTNPIPRDGTIRRHEKLLVKVTQIEGACYAIHDFFVVFIPPAPLDDTNEVLSKWGLMFNKNNFQIDPYTIKSIGKVILKVFPTSVRTKIADPETCHFNVDYAKPDVILPGGSEEFYPANIETIITSQAKDLNVEDQNSKDLSFTWKCSVLKGSESGFCNEANMKDFNDKSTLIIPATAARKDNAFSISIEVGLKNVPNYVTRANQNVYYTDDHDTANKLGIQCIKNCIPKTETTLSTLPVILKAICENCGLIGDSYLLWTIKDFQEQESVDYSKLKSRKGGEFYLRPTALKDNEKYEVMIQVIGVNGAGMSAKFRLYTKLPPPVKDCSIDPNSGLAFETGFQIKCSYFPRNITYEIFALKDGKASLMATTKFLEGESFMLPASATVLLNITDDITGYTQSVSLDVKVKEGLDLTTKHTDAEISDAVDDKLDLVVELARGGNPKLAFQGLAAIVSEYSSLSPGKQDVVQAIDEKVIDVIKGIRLDSPERAQQAVGVVAQITDRYTKSDPKISAQTTEICVKAGKVLLNRVKEAGNPELIRTQVSMGIRSLATCSQASLKENAQSIQTAEVAVILPITKYPLLPAQNQLEHYPDYTDDELSSDNVAQFEKAARSMKNICFSNAKMMAFTMVPEEDPLVTVQGFLTIVAARIYCHDIVHRKIETVDASIEPSAECRLPNIPIVDILMCSTSKNPYWYIDSIPLLAPIVYIQFSGNRIQRKFSDTDLLGRDDPLDGAFKVALTINENVSVQLKVHRSPLPNAWIGELDETSFYDKISVHRIFVFKNRGFSVKFLNIIDADSYDISITNFEKPGYAYFKASRKIITANKSIEDIKQTQPYDSFWYLGVLPSQKMRNLPSGNERSYSFSVSTVGCYVWNASVKRWEFACHSAPRGTKKEITCHCKSGSIFTGYIRDNKVNLVENFSADFSLNIKFEWILYVTAAVTFCLFCMLLLFTSFEQPHNIFERVFFVGDVPSFYQYGYIVIVKTGNKRQSGTTSNVTIKLRGSEGESLEHLLNYPDPELLMMQRSTETYFVLATEKLLGELKELEIWFDSVGNNSKWYCSRIEIYDIQDDKSWLFKVEKWFDVTQRDHNKFVFAPTTATKLQQKKRNRTQDVVDGIKSFLGKMENEVNLWNLFTTDPLLSRKERATLAFSSIALTYLAVMTMYSIPKFNETDSIDEYTLELHHELIWTPILGATVAFSIHFPVMFFIKRGKASNIKAAPVKAITLCWILVVFITTVSMTVIVVCGFWIPMQTSLLWLVSVMLGICFNIAVLQNVSSVLYGYFIKLPKQMQSLGRNANKIIEHVELQRAWIFKRFGYLALRPYLRHLYFSLDSITIKERFKWEETKLKIKEILEDLVMITLYVALLYIVLALEREPQATHNHDEMKNLILGKTLSKKMSIRSIARIEDFMADVLLPSIQSIHWYGKFIQDIPGMTKDFSNKYLGIIRLRQHRTKEIKCDHPEVLKFLNATCRPDYKSLKEYGSFSRGWKPASDISNISTERMGDAWRYSDITFTEASRYFGEYGVYPGGGYVASLGRNLKNSIINLNYLKKHKWLDLRTRALFVEFLAYNPNVNLFNSIALVFEINSSGHILRNLQIQTRKLLMINKDRIFTKNVTYTCFALVILALIIRIMYKIVKKKRTYFYDVWSIFDIIIVLLSGISIFLYYTRLGQIYTYISKISNAKNNEFVNYFDLFAADNILATLTATLVFLSTLRLWKLLRFMVIVKITEKALKDACVPLLVCLAYQMIYMVAFSAVGTLLFGAVSKDFRDFPTSLTTLLLFGLNLYGEFETGVLTDHPLGIAFYTLYMLFSLFFFTLYIAIVSLYYADAKDYYADEPGFVQTYLREKWIYYKTLIMVRAKKLRGGEDTDEDLIIKPKSGERYENCFTIARSRLDTMAMVTMCVLRNLEDHKIDTEKDIELMSRTVKSLFAKESAERDIFFTSHDSQHVKFVDDRRIVQIANICETFIKDCQNIPRVSRRRKKSLIDERIERINSLVDNVKMINSVLDNIRINFK